MPMEIIWIPLVFLLNGTKNYIATKLFTNKNKLFYRHNKFIILTTFLTENRMNNAIFQKLDCTYKFGNVGAAPKYLDPKYLGIVKTLPNPT